jgi:hypothetical protein
MIDSILFWGAGSKNGDRTVALADIKAAVAKFLSKREDDSDEFNFSSVVRIEIVTAQAVVDSEGNVTSPRTTMPGFGVLIATEDQDDADAIWNLPDNLCRVQLDRESGKVIRRRVSLAMLRGLSIEPMFAGSKYDFSNMERV